MFRGNLLGGVQCEAGEPPAVLTLIVDHGDKQFNCKITSQIHHCVQPVRERRTPFDFDILVFQLAAALHQCCHDDAIRKGALEQPLTW